MSDENTNHWKLVWPHGELLVYAAGGMLGGLRLRLADGRVVAPLYEPEWLAQDSVQIDDPFLRTMRNEFVCLPFGSRYQVDQSQSEEWAEVIADGEAQCHDLNPEDELSHGYCASASWSLRSLTDTKIVIEIVYPEASPIERIIRSIEIDPFDARVMLSVVVHARRACRRPFGVHPNFALPSGAGMLRIKTGAFDQGGVHPALGGPGISSFAAPGAVFHDLDSIPLKDGSVADFGVLLAAQPAEEILLLSGASGDVIVENDEMEAAFRLKWDRETLPSLLLWMSNGGRSGAPWSGRNRCLGVEPVASAFDLGTRASLVSNPLNRQGHITSVAFDPAKPFVFSYEISASGL